MTFGCSKQRVISSHGCIQNLLKRKSGDFVILRLMHAPFLRWEKGRALGDDIIGPDNFRRYFEQRFHDQNDSFIVFKTITATILSNLWLVEYASMPC